MAAIDAVCFDLDGTICVSEQTDDAFLDAVFGRAGVDPLFTAADLRAIEPGDIEPAANITAFYTNLYREAVRRSDVDIPADSGLVDELGRVAGKLYDETAVTFREGADELLAHARDRYDVGLITNGTRRTQQAKLDALGIADAFDVTVICDPAHGISGKPAREPFERALAELATPAETTIHVGNSHGEDVVGAHNAGLQSVWAPTGRPHEEYPADPDPAPTYRVDTLADLFSII